MTMVKFINYGFALNLANPNKKNKTKSKKAISRRCLCVVIKDTDNTLKARIVNPPSISESYVIPFTDESFEVNNKEYVFTKKIQKDGKRVLIIRDEFTSKLISGDSRSELACYSPIVENIVLSGYIIKINDKMYFDYENLIAFREGCHFINPCSIDEESPLF